MATAVLDAVLDAALNLIADNCNKVFFCSADPGVGTDGTAYTLASATYALADDTVVVGDGNGNYAVGNGDVSGRKLTVTCSTGITVDANGTISHVALGKSSTNDIYYVKELDSGVAVTTANTLDPAAFPIELSDPADD